MLKKQLEVFWKYRNLLQNLITRDLKVKYRRSILGVLWSVLNPLLMMLVITLVFAKMFRFNVPNFHLFYLTGALIFNFVSEATSAAMSSLIGASNLIKKVYIPKYIFPLEKALFAFVNMMFSMVAVIIVMLFTGGMTFRWSMLLFWVPMVYALIFAVGLSLLLAAITVFFRDMLHLYAVVLTAWMYATPIIYPIEAAPIWLQQLMQFNPLYHYVSYFRIVMHTTGSEEVLLENVSNHVEGAQQLLQVVQSGIPTLQSNLICLGIGLLMLLIGLLVFRKTQDKFVMHL